MTTAPIGFAAALEQFAPPEAVRLATLAEQHGFSGTLVPDAFQPFTAAQGQAGAVWPTAGALGAVTTGEIGVGAVAPVYRSHPAVVAQNAATLAALYPERTWLAIGSGEAISDHVVGGYWPEAAERLNRMFDALTIIRKLFASGASGRDVRHDGEWNRLESSRLWSVPEVLPPLLIATAGPITARRAGTVADGLLFDSVPADKIPLLLQRYAEGAREARREQRGRVVLRLHVSWDETDELATAAALREWPQAGLRFAKSDVRSPHELAQMAAYVRSDDFDDRMLISSDPEVHRAGIQRYLDLGVDTVFVHNVGRNQERFIEVFGRDVLPFLRR